MGGSFGRLVKGKRELEEHGAEFACVAENVEAGADVAFVFGGGQGFVREALPEFCGEEKREVCGYALDPACGVVRADRLIKRSVDFDGIEKLGEERSLVKVL